MYQPYNEADGDRSNLIVQVEDLATNDISTVISTHPVDGYSVVNGQIVFNSAQAAPVTAVSDTLNTFNFDGTDTYDLQDYMYTTYNLSLIHI